MSRSLFERAWGAGRKHTPSRRPGPIQGFRTRFEPLEVRALLSATSNNPQSVVAPIASALAETASAPIARDDVLQAINLGTRVIEVLANDQPGGSPIDYARTTITQQPAHGTVAIDRTRGYIRYTPLGNYLGEDLFRYKVVNQAGLESNEAAVAITVKWPVTLATITGQQPTENSDGTRSVTYSVRFTDTVRNVDRSDFVVIDGADSLSRSVVPDTSISPAGSAYKFTFHRFTGDVVPRIALRRNSSIVDKANAPLGGAWNALGHFDFEVPRVLSVSPETQTSQTSVTFLVNFSENVTGFDPSDLRLVAEGSVQWTTTSIEPRGPDRFAVHIDDITGDGKLRVDVLDNDSIRDATNLRLGGIGTQAGVFFGETCFIGDAPRVAEIGELVAVSEGVHEFLVRFTKPVSGVDLTDFALLHRGTILGTLAEVITVNASDYRVRVHGLTNFGRLELYVLDDDTIVDDAGQSLGGPGLRHGEFRLQLPPITTPLDQVWPSVFSIVRTLAIPEEQRIEYTINWSEPVSGVDASDFRVVRNGEVLPATIQITSNGTKVLVSGVNDDGTVELHLIDNDSIRDAAQNPLGGTGTGAVNFIGPSEHTPPRIRSFEFNSWSAPGEARFDLRIDQPVTGVDVSDFAFSDVSVLGHFDRVEQVTPTVFSIFVDELTSDGTLQLLLLNDASIKGKRGLPLTITSPNNNRVYPSNWIEVDLRPPGVRSITRTTFFPELQRIEYVVSFDEAVNDVDAGDFRVTFNGSPRNVQIDVPEQWPYAACTVTVTGITDETGVKLELIDDDSIKDGDGTTLGGAGVGNGNFVGPTLFAPPKALESLSSFGGKLTLDTAFFRIGFTEPVSGVDVTDFSISLASKPVSIERVEQVAPTQYFVYVRGIAPGGKLTLNLKDDDSIVGSLGLPLGGVGPGNWPLTLSTILDLGVSGPPVVTDISRISFVPERQWIKYFVAFSEPVFQVDRTDFEIVRNDVVLSPSISVTKVDSRSFHVSLTGISDESGLQIRVVDNDSIIDSSGLPLAGPGLGNGDFTGPTRFANPSVTQFELNRRPLPTSMVLTLQFSEPVSGADVSDFALLHQSGAASVARVEQSSPTQFSVFIEDLSDGPVAVRLVDDDSIHGKNGNPLGGFGGGNGNFTSTTLEVDTVAPRILSIEKIDPEPAVAEAVRFRVTFSESVTNISTADFVTIATGSISSSGISRSSGGTSFIVTVNGITGQGTLTLKLIDRDVIRDSASNILVGVGTDDGSFMSEPYQIDRSPPNLLSIKRQGPAETSDSTVSFIASFSEPVMGVDASDFATLTNGFVTVTGLRLIAQSSSVYIVTVLGVTGTGTLSIDLQLDGTIRDVAGNALKLSVSVPSSPFANAPVMFDIVARDLNGDGNVDLVKKSIGPVYTQLGNGDGTFQQENQLAHVAGWNSAVADLNGDHIPDIITANHVDATILYNGIAVWLGNGDGTFQTPRETFSQIFVSVVEQLAVGDINSDSNPDVVVVLTDLNNDNRSIRAYMGIGDGTTASETVIVPSIDVASVALADMNNDGKLDLIAGTTNPGTLGVRLGNGDGTFNAPSNILSDFGVPWLRVADVNNDGHADVIASEKLGNTSQIALGNGDGTLQLATIFIESKEVLSADLNNDGLRDLAYGNVIRLGQTDGTFGSDYVLDGITNANFVTAFDADGNGLLDLLNYSESNSGSLILNPANALHVASEAFTINSPVGALADVAPSGSLNDTGSASDWALLELLEEELVNEF